MIANHYVVTGKQCKTRFWLRQDGLATGFRKGAKQFLTRPQAQAIADKENASGVWRFKWVVTVRQVWDICETAGSCDHNNLPDEEESDANARLMAAAPTLYHAARAALEWFDSRRMGTKAPFVVADLRAALTLVDGPTTKESQ